MESRLGYSRPFTHIQAGKTFLKEILLDQSDELHLSCPQKDPDCPVLNELHRLQREVKRLEGLTQIDPLTGLFNFRHLVHALEAEIERSKRTGLPTSLIMIDLDRFKSINDHYGHESGNEVLKEVARVFFENIRRIDIPCRYGGEEFAIILPGTYLPQAALTAERLRFALEKNKFRLKNETVKVTASFGVAIYDGSEDLSPEAFIERSDVHLLEAKAKGRNRVCVVESKEGVRPEGVTLDEKKMLFDKAHQGES
ncbi:MAG: GGDEF domain-containing protein [Desulfatiglans sp.]|nr:GGDEF domain-containing protein [Thermodesulfobacteriota bacterium]MEE4353838.1 GGDEF domain-containing protein [Desulfatiglans sp.]